MVNIQEGAWAGRPLQILNRYLPFIPYFPYFVQPSDHILMLDMDVGLLQAGASEGKRI